MSIFRRKPHDITSEDFAAVMSAYLEGALDPTSSRALEAHLDECPACALYLEQLRATMAATGRIELDQLSADARSELFTAFSAWRDGADPSHS